MVRPIVKDVILLGHRSTAADRSDTDTIKDLADTLAANSDHCVGMAANMIGVNKTILAAQFGKDIVIMINPKITDKSKACYEAEEGCLSLTGERKAKRHSVITVEYLDKKFKKKKQTFSGLDAQIIQHEMDHFEGIII